MEPSVLRRRVREAIDSARQHAANRRAATDQASRAWLDARTKVVIPAWQQTVQVLRAEGYLLQVSSPGETVRVSFEKNPRDGVEFELAPGTERPVLVLRVTRSRGREVTSDERVAVEGAEAIAALDDEQACVLLLGALGPFFSR